MIFLRIYVVAAVLSLPGNLLSESDLPLCKENECSLANKGLCRCYCSVLCGPRDIGSVPGDNPKFTYASADTDKELGKHCFCQQRDRDLYIKNECYAGGKQAKETKNN